MHDTSREVEKLAGCWIETTGADSCRRRNLKQRIPEQRPRGRSFSGRSRACASRRRCARRWACRSQQRFVCPCRSACIGLGLASERDRSRSARSDCSVDGRERGGPSARDAQTSRTGAILRPRRIRRWRGCSAPMQIVTAPPAAPPLAFRANDLPVLVLTRDSDTASTMPQPSADYPAPVGRLDLNSRFVDWRLIPQPGAPIIRVDRDGLIHALRPGESPRRSSFRQNNCYPSRRRAGHTAVAASAVGIGEGAEWRRRVRGDAVRCRDYAWVFEDAASPMET